MSEFKIAGCCTQCDEPCFEIVVAWEAHERTPGEPKRLGPPNDGAVRITFTLFDGSVTDLTFCAACADALQPDAYPEIWRKNLRSWLRQLADKPEMPEWFTRQFHGGLLVEVQRLLWTEVVRNG